MRLPALKTNLVDPIASLRARTKFILCIWVIFFVLVALGVHGSSIGVTAEWWAAEKPYSGYLFGSPAVKEQTSHSDNRTLPNSSPQPTSLKGLTLQALQMHNAREIRWDELVIATPWALSQLSHNPRFPVVNTNIGTGQNMLVQPHAPVLHIVTLARPATWGYFLFGAQRGLAWYWWFQPFACFTVLWLFFEIALGGHSKLAAFGAFWFCNSAYVICWSLWPNHVIFFAALGCLAAYHLLSSEKRSVRIISATLLGLSLPGFIMILYPPWQVPAAYFVLLLFAAIVVRDKLHISAGVRLKQRSLYIGGAMGVAAGLTLAWLLTCLSDLQAMSNAVYPGRRISLGGDYSFALFFKGIYNLATIYNAPQAFRNQSESASFYYLFPAVLIGLCLSKSLRRNLGIAGWMLVGYITAALIFLFVGLPPILSRLTLLSYVPSHRTDLTIGLASILLSMRVLAITKDLRQQSSAQWNKLWPLFASVGVFVLLLWHGRVLMNETDGFPSTRVGMVTALLGGIVCYFLLSGHRTVFCSLVFVIVVGTTVWFNPLSTDLSHLYDSELGREITRLNKESSSPPLWICYGGAHTGVLVYTLGGRSVSGVHWPPQLSMWRVLDPGGLYEIAYNQYAEVSLDYLQDASRVSFGSPHDGELRVFISPNNVGLKTLGARYLLLAEEAQGVVPANFRFLSKTTLGNFAIFEFPDSGVMGP